MFYFENKLKKSYIKLGLFLVLAIFIGLSPLNLLIPLLVFISIVITFLFIKHDIAINLMLFFLPFHTLVTYYLLPRYFHISNSLISPWRELIIILLGLKLLWVKRNSIKKIRLNSLLTSILFFIIIGIIYVVSSTNLSIALYGFRTYYFVFLAFVVFYSIPIKNVNKTQKIIIYSSLFTCLYGYFQYFILGPEFLLEIGYGMDGRLPSALTIAGGIQRMTGPFSSPNGFANYLMVVIILTYNFYNRNKSKIFLLIMNIQILTLIFTFSRSAWISLIIAMIFYQYKSEFINFKNLKRPIIFIYVLSLIISIFPILFPELTLNLYNHVFNTFTLKDPSTVGHLESLILGFNNIISHPFGFGLGMSGPRSQSYILGGNFINVENSYFLIAYELGIFGLAAFLLLMVNLCKFFKKSANNRVLNTTITIALLISFVFLPNIQSLDFMYFYWIVIALNLKERK